ncbi:hypothetical protein MCOR25_001951 [Pyricularia grisea]|nr:hypothetical protein MCOR25_001951 [Pyricularia grisea]
MASNSNDTSDPPSSFFQKLGAFLGLFSKPQPPLPDYPHAPGNSAREEQTDITEDIQKLGFKDIETLLLYLNSSLKGVNDDKQLLLERLIQLLSKLPPTSTNGKKVTDGLITGLWESLDHPPVSSLGEKYRFREADGSNNNIHKPTLGVAGSHYARSAKPMVYQNPNPPEPETIFDTLMARDPTKFRPHPNQISSVLFYFATIITHDIFQTSSRDPSVNLTSSYLDLSPLYGRNLEEQLSVRTMKDGLLKSDTFCSKRVHGFPPGVGVLLIMFNRFHNYVVTSLAKINEGNRFKKPAADDTAAWEKYDNDLFQTGRLITCGLYVNIILVDYVRTILNLNRVDSSWILDPRTDKGKSLLSKPTPEAVGNQVSVEFNLIYRWHCGMSQRDDKWTTDMLTEALGGKDPATATLPEFFGALGRFESSFPNEPEKRTLAGLQRQEDGTFEDEGLIKIMQESIEEVAGAFGPNHVPACMRAIEILGMNQARSWNVATLNEFREFIGLKRYDTFEDINPDPKVANLLAELYGSPDAVELYPGINAEAPKPVIVPGSGLCPPATTGRAILSDAVTLVRGDRFFTVDYTPRNLTNFGYQEAATDKNVDNGNVIYKLFFRAFPNHYAQNSIYAHFPFVIPSENKKIMESLGLSDKYSWQPPQRKPVTQMIRSHAAAVKILNNQQDFKVIWGESIGFLSKFTPGANPGSGFALAGDGPANQQSRDQFIKCIFSPEAWEDEARRFCEATTWDLLRRYSAKVQDKGPHLKVHTHEVDVIRDVISLANARFFAAMYSLPLKIEGKEGGVYSDHDMYRALMLMFSAIFWDNDVSKSFKLRQDARAASQKLGAFVERHIEEMGSFFHGFKHTHAAVNGKTNGHANGGTNGHANGNGIHQNGDSVLPTPMLKSYGDLMLRRMVEAYGEGKSVKEAVFGQIMPSIGAGTANQTQIMAQCLDYYMSDDGAEHLPEMKRLANLDTPEAFSTLMKYLFEGARIRNTTAIPRLVATDQTVQDDIPCLPDPRDPTFLRPIPNPQQAETTRTVKMSRGSIVLVDLTVAAHDATAFPDPEKVRLDRDLDSYTFFGLGPHRCAGENMVRITMTAVFKVLLQLDGLRRAEGGRGVFKSLPASQWNGQVGRAAGEKPQWSGLRTYVNDDESAFSQTPMSMKIRWDD